jgi:hypothetical protein
MQFDSPRLHHFKVSVINSSTSVMPPAAGLMIGHEASTLARE